MKSRTHICMAIGVLLTVISVLETVPASAQRFNTPGPVFQPRVRVPAAGGQIYLQGGLRFRNIQTFRFNSLPHTVRAVGTEGTPAFGPNRAGDFGNGTGVPGFPADPTYVAQDDPDSSGIWLYTNGRIDARSPCESESGCNVDPGRTIPPIPPTPDSVDPIYRDPNATSPPAHCCAADNGEVCPLTDWPGDDSRFYPAASSQIGHWPTSATEYPDPFPQGPNSGWFMIGDPAGQANGAGPGTTTSVSFLGIIDGTYDTTYCLGDGTSEEVESIIYRANGIQFANQEFMEKVWTPAVEIGFQYSNFFDFFYSFSFYDLSRGMTKSSSLDAQLYRRTFTDTYPYYTPNTVTEEWPHPGDSEPNFSSLLGVRDSEGTNYNLWVNGPGRGFYPNRTFGEVSDGSKDTRKVRETLTHRADIHVYENRLGMTSWFPLYGSGRVGFSAGAQLSYIAHRLTGRREVVAEATLDYWRTSPYFPAGAILADEAHSMWDWWFNYGGFLGTDLEVDYRGFFFRGSAEWAYCETESKELYSILTEFNPGGISCALSVGARF